MEFDLEIISEESDNPDPLFHSIMNAMNSMKEATADKIYQKIQREGETNYSKPQVDRALANALKYGIFEVRNNRYRVREDILDDEDTVYWKLQKYKEQTPFRIQEDTDERHYGPKLDPERDNKRFRKPINIKTTECPQCGRTRKPSRCQPEKKNNKLKKKIRLTKCSSKKKRKYIKNLTTKDYEPGNIEYGKRNGKKRKKKNDPNCEERRIKIQRLGDTAGGKVNLRKTGYDKGKKRLVETQNARKFDYTDELEGHLLFPSEDEQSVANSSEKDSKYGALPQVGAECEDTEYPGTTIIQTKTSSLSMKSESNTEKSEHSSLSNDYSNRTRDEFYENIPGTSTNMSNNRAHYSNSNKIHSKHYERVQGNECDRKSDWVGCLDEPQGTVIQSNNVLTIEPMDSLAFKPPEQASYIS